MKKPLFCSHIDNKEALRTGCVSVGKSVMKEMSGSVLAQQEQGLEWMH